ncbi:hypothetical protein K438DRAFT_1934078 [Mycena galopus ATCC 62051]|nr:hypothetical protein K438DRAFT_1934078 [Mycena galopus ATCC 62051]
MPRQPTVAETHLDHIITCLTLTLPLLKELNNGFGPPFITAIATIVQTLIHSIRNVKQNKSQCAQLMGNIHEFLFAIVNLHMKLEIVGSLSLVMLHSIGKFMETLHKIYIFIEGQQEGNKIKHLFRHNEMNRLLKECENGLAQAREFFSVQTQTQTLNDIRDFKKTVDLMHKELMDLIEKLSDISTLSERSSVYLGANESKNRFFVSAEAATTSVELAALIGLHVGLNPGQDLTKSVVQYFSRKMSCLLILDNLETVWEPIQSRPGVEEFLSLLTAQEHLALLVDNSNAIEEIDQLLGFTDNVPLAIDLIAHLADYEGFSNVLSCWKTEKTSLLSVGFDRQSSLDVSIGLSLSSPRITPDSKELLSLLSILPNGLSERELVQGNLGIPNILSCKAVLQATALAYRDSNQRLMLLMPIREYIQRILPPSLARIDRIRQYYYVLVELSRKYRGEQLQPVVKQITLNLANLHDILQQGLHPRAPTLADTGYWARAFPTA